MDGNDSGGGKSRYTAEVGRGNGDVVVGGDRVEGV